MFRKNQLQVAAFQGIYQVFNREASMPGHRLHYYVGRRFETTSQSAATGQKTRLPRQSTGMPGLGMI